MSQTCDLEEPEFYNWSEPKARKLHRCSECRSPIDKGETYFVASGKFDGYFFTERQHLLCCEACMVIRDSKLFWGGECIAFGSLMDHAFEFRHDIRADAKEGKEDAIKLRSLLAKIKWRQRKAKMECVPKEN